MNLIGTKKSGIIILLCSIPIFLTIESFAQTSTINYTFQKGVNIAHWTDHLFTGRTYGDPLWFAEPDVEWIAKQGIDHLQIRVAGEELVNKGKLDFQRLSVLDSAIHWAEKHRLGIILTIMNFPAQAVDSLITENKPPDEELNNQTAFWETFATHFSAYGENVRFGICGRPRGITSDIRYLNKFNQRILATIRQSNPGRTIYIPLLSTKNLSEYLIPSDEHIYLTFDYYLLEVFGSQYMGEEVFAKEFPQIHFPDTIPDLTEIVPQGHWTRAFSGLPLTKDAIDKEFQKIYQWKNSINPEIGLYLPAWGYYTGWPYQPESIKDKKSIENYGEAIASVCEKYQIDWAIYDYNSGKPIRMENDEPSILLKSLKLN